MNPAMLPLFLRYHAADRSLGVALVHCDEFASYEETADGLYSEHGRALASVDVLVIRPCVTSPLSNIGASQDLAPFKDRAPRASLHCLTSDAFTLKLTENLNARVAGADLPHAFLDWLREEELRSFVSRSHALFRARPGFVFRSPSGRYYRKFLRVGNVQMTRQTLDAVFFWMLPHLDGCGAILTETWSISSIALNAAHLLRSYAADRRCQVDMLASYHDGSPDLVPETLAILRRLVRGGNRVLLLLSAVASGNSLRRLRDVVSDVEGGPDSISLLALYSLAGDPGIPVLCSFEDQDGNQPDLEPVDAPIEKGLGVVEIDRKSYFPARLSDSLVQITEPCARPSRAFFNDYQGSGAVVLHRYTRDSDGVRRRHHAVDLDVEAMLRCNAFQVKLQERIACVPIAPKFLVTPRHRAGDKLAEACRAFLGQRFGSPPPHVRHPDLHPSALDTPREWIRGASQDDLVMIVDDVSVTGHRLAGYQKNLRELGYAGRVLYLVGVARPSSDGAWSSRERELGYRRGMMQQPHIVDFVDKVILPDWTEAGCPWCREQEALRLLLRDPDRLGESYDAVTRRLNKLLTASDSTGLLDGAVWRTSDAPLRLTTNSIYFEHRSSTEADVIAAVAAALQQMRTSEGLPRLDAGYPGVVVLDPDQYFGETRANDSLLRVATLRMATRRELERVTDSEEEKRRASVLQFFGTAEGDLDAVHLEMTVAALDFKLPRPELQPEHWDALGTCEYRDLVKRVTSAN